MKKNILYQWSYQILTLLTPFITVPYVSRLLGAEGIGTYSYHYSIANYFMLFAMLGINTYGNRSIAKVRGNKTQLNETFSEILCLQAVCSLIMTLLYLAYIFVGSTNKVISMIQIIYILGCACDINWFYFGLEEFKVTVMRNFIVKIITVIFIFVFIRSSADIYTYTIIMAVGTVISQSIMWVQFSEYAKLVKIHIMSAVKSHVRGILILFIPTIAASVYKIMDKLMLGNMSGMLQVGYYENSEKIINLINSFILSVGTVMLPRISNMAASGQRKQVEKYMDATMEACLMASTAMAFGLMAVSDNFVILFFGQEFEECAGIMKLLAFTLIFSACSNVIRTQYLIPYDRDKELSVSLILGAFVNIISNLFLIPRYAAAGAAIGTIAAEFTVCMVQFYFMAQQYAVLRYFKSIASYMVKGIIMFLLLLFVPFVHDRFLTILLQVIIGMGIYGGLSWYIIKKKFKSIN